jgi:hypothetical protein
MRFFVALGVAALGMGAFAAAAVLYDRKAHYLQWLRRRRSQAVAAGDRTAPSGSIAAVTSSIVPLSVVGLGLLGAVLVFVACVGLIRF